MRSRGRDTRDRVCVTQSGSCFFAFLPLSVMSAGQQDQKLCQKACFRESGKPMWYGRRHVRPVGVSPHQKSQQIFLAGTPDDALPRCGFDPNTHKMADASAPGKLPAKRACLFVTNRYM